MNSRSLHVGVIIASCLFSPLMRSPQTGKSSQLEVHIRYTGNEKLSAGHKLYALVLDVPKNKAPFAIAAADIDTGVARFENLQRSPVFVVVYFDPHSEGEPDLGKPPRLGSIMNVYGSMQAPRPVELLTGKTTSIVVTLDDSGRVKGIAKERTAKLASVKDPLIPGSLPVYYTPGYVRRAERLQSLLGGELEFYKRRFN